MRFEKREVFQVYLRFASFFFSASSLNALLACVSVVVFGVFGQSIIVEFCILSLAGLCLEWVLVEG